MSKFIHIVMALMASLFVSAAFSGSRALAAAAADAATIVIVFPAKFDAETKEASRDSLEQCITTVPGGTRLKVIGGASLSVLSDFEVSTSTSKQARLNHARPKVAKALEYLNETAPVQEGDVSLINLPALTEFLAAMPRHNGKAPKVLLIASPFHADPKDPSASFGPGHYPNDACILEDSMGHAFGTSDRRGVLDGVSVHWAVRDSKSSTRESSMYKRFHGQYLHQLGANLATYLGSAELAIERAVNGTADVRVKDELDRTIKEARIVAMTTPKLPSTPEQPSKTEESKDVPPPPLPPIDELKRTEVEHSVDLRILVDATSSMSAVLDAAGRMAQDIARLGARLTPRFTLSVVAYRNATSNSSFGPTHIEKPDTDQAECAGVQAFRTFMTEPALDVRMISGAFRESGGQPTGETRKLPHMSGLIAYADLEAGLREGLTLLGQGKSSRKVLLIVGDVGASESDGAPGMSEADDASADRTISALDAFVKKYPDSRIVTVFCGSLATPNREETVAQFKRLSSLSGTRGVYSEDLSEMEAIVTRAILGE